jgi:hypothetical protein
MTGSADTAAGAVDAPLAARETAPLQENPSSVLRTPLPERCLAVLHELSERLTAATNYLASGLRPSERTSRGPANTARQTEALEKALGQLNQADDIVISLRQLLSEESP